MEQNQQDMGSGQEDDTFSIIEQPSEASHGAQDEIVDASERKTLVQDLYEGPRRCQCCINWIDTPPPDVHLVPDEELVVKPVEEAGPPLLVRRRMAVAEGRGHLTIHSIEIRDEKVRCILATRVFNGYDNVSPAINCMVLYPPFKPFFYRWSRFEAAIEQEKDAATRAVLLELHGLVLAELGEVRAASDELIRQGLVAYEFLWMLFTPGDMIYCDLQEDERLYCLQSSFAQGHSRYDLLCRYVDWDGKTFGTATKKFIIYRFIGSRPIKDLLAFPVKHHPHAEGIKQHLLQRGQRFRALAGIHYKSYRPFETANSRGGREKPPVHRRIIVDAKEYAPQVSPLPHLCGGLSTGGISQTPLNLPPVTGHVPLQPAAQVPPLREGPCRPVLPYPAPGRNWIPGTGPGPNIYNAPGTPRQQVVRDPVPMTPKGPKRRSSSDSLSSTSSDDSDDGLHPPPLSDYQLQLCPSTVEGFCLKSKTWRKFYVDRIEDIVPNPAPFDGLVLPAGYKDLILSFVESQIELEDTFDDVINGKGGGLVLLLAGDPGVGKTLTAEAVAEKMKAPLYKLELGLSKARLVSCKHVDDSGSEDEVESAELNIADAFECAARWKAVLLIDECDTYLSKRNEGSYKRNKIVTRFLKELEYYPTLLFLTTNREKDLDPGILSRVHLTINYPSLDEPSRQAIWDTFLQREGSVHMGAAQMAQLRGLELNGRQIRNVVKTARIMANRTGRPIEFRDVRNVLSIVVGKHLDGP